MYQMTVKSALSKVQHHRQATQETICLCKSVTVSICTERVNLNSKHAVVPLSLVKCN